MATAAATAMGLLMSPPNSQDDEDFPLAEVKKRSVDAIVVSLSVVLPMKRAKIDNTVSCEPPQSPSVKTGLLSPPASPATPSRRSPRARKPSLRLGLMDEVKEPVIEIMDEVQEEEDEEEYVVEKIVASRKRGSRREVKKKKPFFFKC